LIRFLYSYERVVSFGELFTGHFRGNLKDLTDKRGIFNLLLYTPREHSCLASVVSKDNFASEFGRDNPGKFIKNNQKIVPKEYFEARFFKMTKNHHYQKEEVEITHIFSIILCTAGFQPNGSK
jgi:hypothetical protein